MQTEAVRYTVDNLLDFRSFLQNELLNRVRRNPRYSLRAFARMLQVESSALSKILRGKRGISTSMLVKLSKNLGLGPAEIEKFQSSTVSRTRPKPLPFTSLSAEAFRVISDWYHYAILEITRVKDFKPEPNWIATRLGISVAEVNIALERLQNLGMLEKKEDGSLVCPSVNHTHIMPGFTDVAMKNFQKQILEKAMTCLEEVPVENRDNTGITMAISTRKMPEAKALIKKFRRELSALLETDMEKDEVYQLVVGLYPLTKQGGATKELHLAPEQTFEQPASSEATIN